MAISSTSRKKYATVAGGKYPIPPGDKGHARAALRLINRAKPPLTRAQKAAVKARANQVLNGK